MECPKVYEQLPLCRLTTFGAVVFRHAIRNKIHHLKRPRNGMLLRLGRFFPPETPGALLLGEGDNP